jgi:Glycoside hydrolase 123, N-terminal domain
MRSLLLCLAILLTFVAGCGPDAPAPPVDPPSISNTIDGVLWESGNWEMDLPSGERGSSNGYHRAVIELDSTDADAARVHIPWLRSDQNPENKSVVVIDALTGRRVSNVRVLSATSAEGDIIFQPVSGSIRYYAYYMPFETSGGFYPKVSYPEPVETADRGWLKSLTATDELPEARVTSIQSQTDFHSFFPMEVVATQEEMNALLADNPNSWLLFPEYRERSIRMRHAIPRHWAKHGPSNEVRIDARRGEYMTFQIGLYAARTALKNVRVAFADWDSTTIPQSGLTCFNCGGIDEFGVPFTKRIDVTEGDVQPLWIGVDLDPSLPAGKYEGEVIISVDAEGVDALTEQRVHVSIAVGPGTVKDHGDDDPARMSRLRWLNSTIGTDPDFIVSPFTPVEIDGKSLHILGRDVALGEDGLPAQITSHFTREMTGFSKEGEPILTDPVSLNASTGGTRAVWQTEPFSVSQRGRGRAEWTARSTSDLFERVTAGALEYDGMLDYHITLIARQDASVDDISLPLKMQPDAAKYILGLGFKGQKRPDNVDWKWKVENHQEGAWLGGIHKGLQYVLRDDNYERPLNTNFYQNQPLHMPPSWFNEGKGGIRISATPERVTALNYSGSRRISKGDTLHFNVRFLITPFKPIDTKTHFNTRFVHKYVPVDSVVAWGGTVVNIHHANEINPYINYPFFNLDKQTAYIEEAHRKGVKFKIYDTVRELTYKAHELFALRSLGDEIFNDGEGGGHPWLQEHLKDRYHSAWHAYTVDDAAILDKGTSRWTNYYIEGLNWLAKNQKIDGLYLDDIAFSRATVKRMMSVLNRHREQVIIDLHSANQFNPRDGFINSAMLYMEHFPYISRLWFGEYFDYDQGPDYWMTEVSGLPFGLMGEMLQGGGHPYRGMLYGMTNRFWGKTDPRPVWNLMTRFGIDEARMVGYWLDDRPVKTSREGLLATTFVRADSALIAIASWSDEDETLTLDIDRDALGLRADAELYAPRVDTLQQAHAYALDAPITVPANMGLFIIARNPN